ncbi:MAG: tRNA lysidine(34) synthetase TilS [bacterium]
MKFAIISRNLRNMKDRTKLEEAVRKLLSLHSTNALEVPIVLVAVSGGADSMALLHAANALFVQGEIELRAAHLLHHPESSEAKRRESLVSQFCHEHSIPLKVGCLTGKFPKGQSPEEAMRRKRYSFLEAVAVETSCHWVLTGHHADDQAETILLRVITGAGLRGLTGIRRRRGIFLRPFLAFPKEMLLEYCRQNNIHFLDDPTNLDLSSPRNRIRHRILPLLKAELNPETIFALQRLGFWAEEALEFIDQSVQDCWLKSLRNFQKGKIILDIGTILQYFILIQKYVLLKAICEAAHDDVQLPAATLNRIPVFLHSARTGAFLSFSGGIRVLKDRDHVVVMVGKSPELDCVLHPGGDQEIQEVSLKACWSRLSNADSLRIGDGLCADLDLGSEPGSLRLRYAQEGDKFYPLGAPGSKRLFRFLMDRKISRFDKRSTLILEKNSQIIWVIGHRISEQVRVQTRTEGVWRLCFDPIE